MDDINAELNREIRKRIESRDYENFDPVEYICTAYQQFATKYTPQIKTFVHTVLNSNGSPILLHCTAGKDRTGYASAVLLTLLGVDQNTIFEDYLLSNTYAKPNYQTLIKIILGRGPRAYRLVRPLYGVQKSWLKTSMNAIDTEWGGFNNYAREGLGLSTGDIDILRDLLLEDD
jgi:protein-tyrosine phosphatase